MSRLAAVVLLAWAGGPVRAEPATPVPAGRRLSPHSDAVLASCTATQNDTLTTWDLRLKAGAPLLRGDGYGIALLAGYGATRLDVAMPEDSEPLTLHRIEATLGGGGSIALGRSLRGSIGAAYSSDLHDFTSRALQVTSSAMLHVVLGPSDAVIGGIIYTSSAEFLPVLPILGYVHQRDGSPFRLDVFLPHHARAEYELRPGVRSALGIETAGNTWIVQMQTQLRARRAGGSIFGEIELAATELVRLRARLGISVDRYTLPAPDGASSEGPLRAAAFAQLAVVIAP